MLKFLVDRNVEERGTVNNFKTKDQGNLNGIFITYFKIPTQVKFISCI